MKALDIAAAVLLVVGGLNWGLVGLLDFNLVTALFGGIPALEAIVYTLVGAAAIYQVASLPWIQRRWKVTPRLVTA